MRLKKLTIQAFGPFKDKVIIDFEKNNINKGLLLITGDTGAGKTSIFDAICFALYGEASSNTRKVNSLRSDFASFDIETYVELSFEHNNKNYVIKRSPEYERKSKRGSGTTKEPASAEFEINGRIETKTTAVTKEIEQLLGLDYRQFHQIAMLSQGEFTKFLLANSDEKTSIFRKIFNTDIYSQIMYKLKDNLSLKEQKYKNIKENIDKERSKLNDESYISLTEEELIIKLEEKINDLTKDVKTIEDKKDKLNKDIQQKKSKLDKINDLNKKIKNYNDTTIKLNDLLNNNQNIEEEQKLIDYNRNIVVELDTILNNIKQNQKELKENKDKYQINIKEKEEIEKQLNSNQEEFKKIDTYNDTYEKLNEELTIKKNYLDKLNDYNRINNNLNKTKLDYQSTIAKLKDKNENYLLMKESYYADLAFSLTSELKDNEPCPVCGSKDHPHIAKQQISICTKKELDQIEKEVNNLNKELNTYETRIEEFKNNITNLNLDSNLNYDTEYKETIELINSIENKIKKLKEENKTLIQLKEKLNNNYTKTITNIKTIELNINKYNLLIKENEDKLSNFLKENNTTIEEYNTKKITKEELNKIETKIKNYNSKKKEYETTINILKEEVEGKKEENPSSLQTELETLNNQFKSYEKDLRDINTQININEMIKNNISNDYKEYLTIKEEYSLIKELSDTANGRLTGKQKITFENYVQSYYLTNVLVEANKRLFKMTDGRYELRRKESGNLNEKIGLEFSVFDAYTGKERDVSSLSGGEKFKASLSLALGLSDVISMYAGGIKMECLFVDEGFGSLDQDSLNQALNTLTDLADNDKLIGIISHVSELISRIENKIIVKKENTGSTITIEV